MPLMPGSPRPGTPAAEVDSGVYRSLFQQPMLDVPPAAPAYAWFEFLLHPEALQQHLQTLRTQRAADAHSATSAMELVREFLDQAQLVADEGHGRNNRYRALLLVAAQVALQMDLGLRTIEQELPLHFQRLLVDGIMDFAEQPKDQRNEFARDVALRPAEARVLHQRWTLRALVSQSQNGYLTCSNSSDGDDLPASYQAALGDLTSSHLQIAQSIQATLAEDDEKSALPLQTQLEAFYDLGMYFFSFSGYERAYGCFSRAYELLEEFGGDRMTDTSAVTLSKEDRDSLEGYLKACEAVMEVRSASEGPSTGLTEKAKVELAWEGQDWDQIVHLLQKDMVAPDLSRFQVGYRTALEQQALRLVRANLDTKLHPDDKDDSEQLAAPVVRFFYKRIAIANAIYVHLLGDKREDEFDLESCACLCARLVQGEIFQAAADAQGSADTNLFVKLTSYVLHLVVYLLENLDGGDPGKTRLKQFVSRMLELVPAIKAVETTEKLLLQCGYSSQKVTPDRKNLALTQLTQTEKDVCGATRQQCEHFRLIADLSRVFEFANTKEKDTFISALREQVATLATNGEARSSSADSKCEWRNLVMFCLVHNCWNTLEQCKALWKNSPKAQREVEFALSCGSLIQFLSTLSASPLPGVQSSDGSGAGASKSEFSISSACKLMADILSKRRQLVGDVSAGPMPSSNNHDIKKEEVVYNEMLDLPVWIVETLVCISAGLLHRAHMRNVCDYRVSFDLTPYGDLAFLQAFAADDPSSETVKSEPGAEVTISSTHFLRSYQSDLIGLLQAGLDALVRRCGREPRWHCAKADLALNPIVRQKLSATSDPLSALKGYLVAASLATNFFADMVSVVDIIDQTSLVRLSQCLVKVGAHTAAAVLYQCFPPEEFKYGLRILQLAPETHDDAFFQYFWDLPFLEMLVHLHSKPKHYNSSHVTLLTHLIQSPELNSSNPAPVVKDAEQRILRCYFRDLCRLYL